MRVECSTMSRVGRYERGAYVLCVGSGPAQRMGCATGAARRGWVPSTHVRMHARNVFEIGELNRHTRYRPATTTRSTYWRCGASLGGLTHRRGSWATLGVHRASGANAPRCLTSSSSADRRRARPSRSANAAGRVPAASCLFCGRNWRYRQLCLRHGRPTQLLACNQLCVHTTKSSRIEIPPADICAARG